MLYLWRNLCHVHFPPELSAYSATNSIHHTLCGELEKGGRIVSYSGCWLLRPLPIFRCQTFGQPVYNSFPIFCFYIPLLFILYDVFAYLSISLNSSGIHRSGDVSARVVQHLLDLHKQLFFGIML